SFFFTQNHYYTIVAAMLNITSLLMFHFVSLNIYGKRALWLMIFIGFSGFLVSIETWLQYHDVFVLFKWSRPGSMITGTIGNANFLGAYLTFPLFALLGLTFLFKRKRRLVLVALFLFVLAAFLFSRARAGWMGFFLSLPLFFLILKRIFKISILEYLRSNAKQAALYSTVLLIMLVSLWAMAPERFRSMMSYRNVTQSDTLKLRTQKYFRASFWLFKQSPLFGTGLWSYRNRVYDAQAEIHKIDENFFKNYPEPKPRRVHNDYLEILNDGGLLAATALLIFLATIMQHGWSIIKDEEIDSQDRIISATAFCSIIAIMLAALLFFPFRVNSTLFMTALNLGLMEGIYLRHRGFINTKESWKSGIRLVFVPLTFLTLLGSIWFVGLKPFMGELAYFDYKRAFAQGRPKEAEIFIREALKFDPKNSTYCLYASQLYLKNMKDFSKARDFLQRSIIEFNGDLTKWSLYFANGLLNFQTGSLFEAKAAFEKALYYYPAFEAATAKLEEVNKILKDHDQLIIKLK
ncbi:MAG: O-antigen ligase family protein, partial [Proteobacteria bacterium]|nr:O-antigen ligase family protein [Pseudomonadota bacterium]